VTSENYDHCIYTTKLISGLIISLNVDDGFTQVYYGEGRHVESASQCQVVHDNIF